MVYASSLSQFRFDKVKPQSTSKHTNLIINATTCVCVREKTKSSKMYRKTFHKKNFNKILHKMKRKTIYAKMLLCSNNIG